MRCLCKLLAGFIQLAISPPMRVVKIKRLGSIACVRAGGRLVPQDKGRHWQDAAPVVNFLVELGVCLYQLLEDLSKNQFYWQHTKLQVDKATTGLNQLSRFGIQDYHAWIVCW